MTSNQYFIPLKGQSLLYPGIDTLFKGQCVQSVMFWIKANGLTPPVYPSAYQYYERGVPGYTKIPAGQPIKEGDIIVWRSDFPPAIFDGVGNGHIDVAAGDGTISDFWAWDQNWTPLKVDKIHHTGEYNTYIFGYLRKEGEPMVDILTARILSAGLLGNNGTNGTKDALSGAIDSELQQYVGKDIHDVVWQFYDSDQGKQYRDYQKNPPNAEFVPFTDTQLFKRKDNLAKTP